MEKLQIRKFGITKDGSKPYLYKMKNDAGMEVQVSDFGATLVNVTVLDQDKNPVEVVLGMRMQPVMKMERQRSVQLSEEMQTGSVVRV